MVSSETKKLFSKLISEIGTELAEQLVEAAKQQNGEIIAGIAAGSKQELTKLLAPLIGDSSFSIEKITENPAAAGHVALVKMKETELRVIRSRSLALFFVPVIRGVQLETNSHQGKYDLKLVSAQDKRIIKSLLRVISLAKAEALLEISHDLAVLLDCPLVEKQKQAK